jgi:hypothetical protein
MASAVKWVEMLGLPGSGKTSLADSVTSSSGATGCGSIVDIREARYLAAREVLRFHWTDATIGLLSGKLRRSISLSRYKHSERPFEAYRAFVANNTVVAQIALKTVIDGKASRAEKGQIFNWLFQLFADHLLIEENLNSAAMVLVDEGFCHRVVTLFGYGEAPIDEGAIRRYINSIPLPTVVFRIETKLEICEERMAQRGYPERLRNLETTGKRRVLERCLKCIEITLNELKHLNIPVRSLNNNGDLSLAKKTILSELGKL